MNEVDVDLGVVTRCDERVKVRGSFEVDAYHAGKVFYEDEGKTDANSRFDRTIFSDI